jgi:uncharacterized protein (TIGR00299 family) protein
MKTLYLECNMGAAGDMLMGALLELYPEKEAFLDKMNHLMDGVTVRAEAGAKCGITGTHMEVCVNGQEEVSEDIPQHAGGHVHSHEHGAEDHVHSHEHGEEHGHMHEHEHEHGHVHAHVHASFEDVCRTIRNFDLPEPVREQACRVYERIAEAESHAHGKPVSEIHFHEVGAKDAIADITGVCYLIHLLGADRVIASPINLGSGNVRCAHGILPVPAPATAFLVQGIPSYMSEIRGELCTPTGAALLKTLAESFGPMPAMAIEKIGYGMGRKEFERANCVRAFLGEEAGSPAGTNSVVCELSANLDDMTAEALGYAQEVLLNAGALDVFAVPIYMKKNRPAYMLTCLCRENDADEMARQMLTHTTTFGVRKRVCERYILDVSWEERVTAYGKVHQKIGTGYGIRKEKTEYEDAARAARESGAPLSDVMRQI